MIGLLRGDGERKRGREKLSEEGPRRKKSRRGKGGLMEKEWKEERGKLIRRGNSEGEED